MNHAEILDQLGGGKAVREGFARLDTQLDVEAIYAWKRRQRIPPEYWPEILTLAQHADLKVTTADLKAGLPRAIRKRRAA